MSRLEAPRKQAKQLVRWHREGNHSIGGRIRGLPRYSHLTDAEALKLKFPLGEAQEIFARDDLLRLAQREFQFQRFGVRQVAVARQPANATADGVISFAMPANELLRLFSRSFESGHGRILLCICRRASPFRLRLPMRPTRTTRS